MVWAANRVEIFGAGWPMTARINVVQKFSLHFDGTRTSPTRRGRTGRGEHGR